jgi:hypothetical protein
MLVRIFAFVSSVVIGFVLPAPLTLLAAGVLQGNSHFITDVTLGKPNIEHAYAFSWPFTIAFGLVLAGFGFWQCHRTYRRPRHMTWHTGFLLLGAAFGMASLLAFQIVFGGGLFSIADTVWLILLGAAAGALAALPVSILWFFIVRRKVHIEHARREEASPMPQHAP